MTLNALLTPMTLNVLFSLGLIATASGLFSLSEVPTAILANLICAVWVGGFLQLTYLNLPDRKAMKMRNPNAKHDSIVRLAFTELSQTFNKAKQYPETFKYLMLHLFADSGVGSLVNQLPTCKKQP